MIYGLYLSAQGADAATFHQSVLANNLANSRTTAFKRDLPVFRAHPSFDVSKQIVPPAPDSLEEQTGGISVEGTVTDFSQGSLQTTGGQLDIALIGRGFLEVSRDGQRFLTRNGKLALSEQQQLVMADTDLPVMSVEGDAIEIPTSAVKIEISTEGIVTGIDGANARAPLGQLALVEPEQMSQLVKEGDSLYKNLGQTQPSVTVQVRQGLLEESDVDPVTGMVDMIQASRGFEMNMNMIRMQDEMLAQLLQSVPPKH